MPVFSQHDMPNKTHTHAYNHFKNCSTFSVCHCFTLHYTVANGSECSTYNKESYGFEPPLTEIVIPNSCNSTPVITCHQECSIRKRKKDLLSSIHTACIILHSVSLCIKRKYYYYFIILSPSPATAQHCRVIIRKW